MKILVNYSIFEKNYLSSLAYILRKLGHSAMATTEVFSPESIAKIAKASGCDVVVLVNENTLRNLVPNKKATLDAYRGSRINLAVPVLVVNSLAHIHTVPYGSFLLENDLKKLSRPILQAASFSSTILTKQSSYDAVLQEMATSLLTAYDIETISLGEDEDNNLASDTLISCASWSCLMPNGRIKTWTLPMIDFGVDHWRTDVEYANALSFLRKANDINVPKVMHNGIYDCIHSLAYRAAPRYYSLDTMAMAHAQYAELPKTLDFVASIHLDDYCQWKDDSEQASKEKDIRKYWGYNGKDTWYTLRIAISQLRNMPIYARHNFADKFKLSYPAIYCTFEGFRIDQEVQDTLRAEAQDSLDRHQALLKTYVDDSNFNPGSWQQVSKYIYGVFGAIKPGIGKSKSATDEKNLLAVGEQHPLLSLLTTSILEYRGAQKAISTYYNFLQKSNRMLWTLNPFGAETERMACNASSFWAGAQIQNIPKYAKKQLIADEGYELAELDNKQSEGRCTAYLAQDEALIKAIEDPVYDFYKTLGTLFFNMKYEEVSEFFRDKVLKKIVHGTNYMMRGKTFKENIGTKILHETAAILGYKIVPKPSKKNPTEITFVGLSELLLEKYHVPFKRVRVWYSEIKAEIASSRTLTSPLGHVRYFFGDISKDHKVLMSAVAHSPQNLSVSILNMGFWKIYKQMVVCPTNGLKLGDFRLKAQIHDSILAQYKVELRDIVVPMMKHFMDNPVEVHGRTLRIPVDAKIGTAWSAMKKYEEPK